MSKDRSDSVKVQEDSKYILLGRLDPENVDTTVRRNVGNYFLNDKPNIPEGFNHQFLVCVFICLCGTNFSCGCT